MLIEKDGTIRLEGMTLFRKMSSETVLARYPGEFRLFLSELGNGVMRSRKLISDENGHAFRVVLNFNAGTLTSVALYPAGEFQKKDAMARRQSIGKQILQDLFGAPDNTTETGVAYRFETCFVTAWEPLAFVETDFCGGVVVDYTPPGEAPQPVFKSTEDGKDCNAD